MFQIGEEVKSKNTGRLYTITETPKEGKTAYHAERDGEDYIFFLDELEKCNLISCEHNPVTDQELKPCPLCGGKAKITSRYFGGKREYIETVSCKKCHLSINRIWSKGMSFETEVDVVKTWNTRYVN